MMLKEFKLFKLASVVRCSDHTLENGVLLIPVVREEDFGVYVCSARNKLGFVEATTELVAGGTIYSGVDRNIGLTVARRNFLSTPETLGNWTDGRIVYRHLASTYCS